MAGAKISTWLPTIDGAKHPLRAQAGAVVLLSLGFPAHCPAELATLAEVWGVHRCWPRVPATTQRSQRGGVAAEPFYPVLLIIAARWPRATACSPPPRCSSMPRHRPACSPGIWRQRCCRSMSTPLPSEVSPRTGTRMPIQTSANGAQLDRAHHHVDVATAARISAHRWRWPTWGFALVGLPMLAPIPYHWGYDGPRPSSMRLIPVPPPEPIILLFRPVSLIRSDEPAPSRARARQLGRRADLGFRWPSASATSPSMAPWCQGIAFAGLRPRLRLSVRQFCLHRPMAVDGGGQLVGPDSTADAHHHRCPLAHRLYPAHLPPRSGHARGAPRSPPWNVGGSRDPRACPCWRAGRRVAVAFRRASSPSCPSISPT